MLDQFREVWLTDFEFGFAGTLRPEVVCLVATVVSSFLTPTIPPKSWVSRSAAGSKGSGEGTKASFDFDSVIIKQHFLGRWVEIVETAVRPLFCG